MEKNRTFRIGPPLECLLNFILNLLFSWMEILSFNNSFHLKKNSLHKSKHLQPWAPISCLTMNHQSHFQGVGYQKKREVFISNCIYSCLWWVKWYHIFERLLFYLVYSYRIRILTPRLLMISIQINIKVGLKMIWLLFSHSTKCIEKGRCAHISTPFFKQVCI